jgi:hypothetical protein
VKARVTRSWKSRVAGLAVVLSTGAAQAADPKPPPPASTAPNAQTAGQTLFTQAMQLFEEGEVKSACRTFERSFEQDPAPGTLYNMAICHQREGLIGKAYREFDDLATRAEDQKLLDKAKAVRARAEALVTRLSILHLVHRADARGDVTGLTLDGESLPKESWRKPVFVDPGAHTLTAQHSDGVAVTREVSGLLAGQTVTLEMEDPPPVLSTSQPEHHPTRRLAAYVTGGIGAALVLGGSVAGVVAIVKKSKVDSECDANDRCENLSGASDAQRTGKTAATLSDIGFAAGGAALAAAVVLFVTSRDSAGPQAPAAATLVPIADPHGGGLGFAGHF